MGVFAPTRFVDRGLESGQGGTAVSWMRCRGAVGRLGAVVLAVVVWRSPPRPARRTASPWFPGSATPSSRWPATAATTSPTTHSGSTGPPSRFDLDLRGFQISRLLVNGQAASFTRDGQELVITPVAGLPAGQAFTVVVDYAGEPSVITDPDGSIEGWVPTDDGAFVVEEPQGSPGWYPVNDNPQDKATYSFGVTVPEGLT